MSLNVNDYKPEKKDFGRLEEGTFSARLVQIIELGMQEQTDFTTGESTGYKPRVLLTFEFPTERITITNKEGEEEDLPRWYGKEYTLSGHEKASLPRVIRSLGGDMDLTEVLGSPCMIEIGSTSGDKAKILSITSPVKGMEVPELENPPVVFDLDSPDITVFKHFPEWIREKVKAGKNYEGSKLDLALSTSEEFEDDIPF